MVAQDPGERCRVREVSLVREVVVVGGIIIAGPLRTA